MTQDSKTESAGGVASAPLALTVPDLAEAIDFFTRRLGFRVDMIVPADAPQTAIISGQGMTLRLETSGAQASLADSSLDLLESARGFVISRMDQDTW
ncbi:MAG: VOC family protein, partial [Blastocatellia bacterium]